jgi:hypothetical protein
MSQNYRTFKKLPADWVKWQPAPDATPPADKMKWSGEDEPPAIGTKIRITMNGIGPAIVRGYFVEYGWLGLLTEVLSPPDWWIKQNREPGKPDPLGHVFGVEFKPWKEVA